MDKVDKRAEVDKVEKQERIYQVGLMLRRKPISFILEYTGKNLGIEKSQTYTYTALLAFLI